METIITIKQCLINHGYKALHYVITADTFVTIQIM